ncbi:hypothetical protein HK405_013756, partial [Cladochytrium tenue]
MPVNEATNVVDLLVFGATGFTGKLVAARVRDLLVRDQAAAGNLPASSTDRITSWGLAARSEPRLRAVLADLDLPPTIPPPSLFIADAGDYASVLAAISSCRVVIACVGPFRFFGEPVVKACVETGAGYVDITGEPEFIERMFVTYDATAKEKGVSIVPCCGFDSIPADLGTLFVKQEFDKQGYTAASVEMMVRLLSGPSGLRVNFATYESAVHGVANAGALRDLRRRAARPPLPTLGPKLPLYPGARFAREFLSWVVPFAGADASVVRMGQQISAAARFHRPLFPVQFSAYFGVSGIFYLAGLMFFGQSLSFLSRYGWGRRLLLAAPGFFSFGIITRKGPTAQQLRESSFVETFLGRGYKVQVKDATEAKKLANTSPDYEIVAKVQGPEMGYVATPICVVAAAQKLLEDK